MLLANGIARAAIVIETSAPFSSGGGPSFTVAIPQFNPSLGILTGASITLNMNLTPGVQIFNPNGSSRTYQYAHTDTISGGATPVVWTDPYGTPFSDNYSFSVGAIGGPDIGSAPPGLTVIPGTPIPESTTSSVPTVNLVSYLGAGTTNVQYDISGSINTAGQGSGLFFGGTRSFAGDADVQYTYLAAVPELGSFLTLGLVSCCALGAMRLGKRLGYKALSL